MWRSLPNGVVGDCRACVSSSGRQGNYGAPADLAWGGGPGSFPDRRRAAPSPAAALIHTNGSPRRGCFDLTRLIVPPNTSHSGIRLENAPSLRHLAAPGAAAPCKPAGMDV